ncbi:EboA domain-containing protein [Streptomyces carpaticus]|uniref:EboA domain-containing protein n=1 Tax=Streptomyces carpaticus TaxID=285558 RepID=UPI00321FA13B
MSAQGAPLSAVFPALARTVGRAGAHAARVTLLRDAARAGTLTDTELSELYDFGDSDEKLAVLTALGTPELLDRPGLLPLTEDALRTNDPRLVAAAMGGYAARHLPPAAWRHGVLKCLFMAVPLDAVSDWADRADAELVRMTRAFAAEREAAGRPIPDDAIRLMERNAS